MKANETSFNQIINSEGLQYVVPLFQRPYSWEKENWQTLMEDLDHLYAHDNPRLSHFIGSMVTIPVEIAPHNISKFLLIDGQQRLTTIFILLMVISDLAHQQENSSLAARIKETYLINRFESGDEYFKLLPTQTDKPIFQELVKHGNSNQQGHRLLACYEFFKTKISKKYDLESLFNTVTSRLSIVRIVLAPEDDPHLVFESLNAKGRQLTEADLIRNYFFMKIATQDHDDIYTRYWAPMQDALKENLTEFIRHYLMRDGLWIKRDHVYMMLKAQLDGKQHAEVLEKLDHIYRYAGYYYRLLNPTAESSPAIQYYIKRLNRMKTTTAYPFLLDCYHDYTIGQLSESDFLEILWVIENYIMRRHVCNVPTNQLNKIFPALYLQASRYDRFVDGVKIELQKKRYPTDQTFRDQLMTADLYGGGDRSERLRIILESLEQHASGKEILRMDDLGWSIEHIMPQTLSPWWENHLGADWEEIHEVWLHTLGNLTLTEDNSELSNAPFPNKQQLFLESRAHLNRYLVNQSAWQQADIEARGRELANQVLQIWSYFGDNTVKQERVTGQKPTRVVILGEEIVVSSWRDVMRKTLNTILLIEPEKFDALILDFENYISYDVNRFPRHEQFGSRYYFQKNNNAASIKKFCERITRAVGWSEEDWYVEIE